MFNIMTIEQISKEMYARKISMREMARRLNVNDACLHAMFKYKDEERNKLLRIGCSYILSTAENGGESNE